MHLYEADEQTRGKTVSEVAAADVGRVFPVHCTGLDAICDLRAALKERCILAGAGDTF